jgi:hypothetical protein
MNNPLQALTMLNRAYRQLRLGGGIAVVAALLLSFATIPANAQEGPSIESLEVVLWPEYDQPAVLVVYRVTLAPDTPLPTHLPLPIPAAVSELHAVASGAAWDDLFLANYTREEDGDWALLTIDVDRPLVQVEYYTDLDVSGASREYTFTWPGGTAIGSMAYEVQTPFGASDMIVSPPGTARIASDGLTYLEGDLGQQEASSSVQISLSYSKPTPGLTIDVLQTTGPLGPAGSEGGLTAGLTRWLPWAAGALGLVLAAGGALWYWRMNRSPAERRARPRQRPPRSREEPSREIDASAVFCHICGTQATVSDRFCRRCGTRLRQ